MKRNAKAQEAANSRDKVDKVKTKGKAKALPQALLQQKTQSIIPFSPTDKILLIGEGNFSFALALFLRPALGAFLQGENVTATAYDSEDACYAKYPDAREIVRALREERSAEVLFGVDATKLGGCKALRGRRWDRVVWNFPHAGELFTFFRSCVVKSKSRLFTVVLLAT